MASSTSGKLKTYDWEFVAIEDFQHGYSNILTHITFTTRTCANKHDAQAKVIAILQNQPSFVKRCPNSERISTEELVKMVRVGEPAVMPDDEFFSRVDCVTVIKSLEW